MKFAHLAAGAALALSSFGSVVAQAADSAPAVAAPAATAETDLKAVVTEVKGLIAAGKTTEAQLAPQLAEFDALIAKYKGQKTDEVAMISYMKATLYLQVLGAPDKGTALLKQVAAEFPGTRVGVAAAHASAPKPAVLAAGTPAPDFKAIEVAGGPDSLTLAQYKGKIVVLDFWATWCGPCQRSMPHLERVYQKVKGQDVVVLGVCVADTKEAYEKWVPEHKGHYNFTVAFDPAARDPEKSVSSKLYGVSGIPTTYIIDKEGKVAAAVEGFSGDSDTRIEDALGAVGVKVSATE